MKKNRLLYAGLFLLSLFFVYFYGGRMPYMLFYVTLLLPVVSLLYIVIIYFRFKYIQEIDKKHVIKGEKITYLFNVMNEDLILYPYIRVTFCGADTIFAHQFDTKNFSLVPYKKSTFSFELECKYRGTYAIGIKTIEITDFLGIFKLKYKLRSTQLITVFPKIVYIDRFHLKQNFTSDTQTTLNTAFEDMTTVSDIRNYSYGDSMKRIHWKLSSKMNKLISKNFQSTSQTNATLFLDLRQMDYPVGTRTIVEDKLIEAVVAVVYYCLSNWIPVDFVFYMNRIVNIKATNPLDFDEIYKILSKIMFNEKVTLNDITDVYLVDNINMTNIVLFTATADYDLYNQIYKIKHSGYEVSLIYVSADQLTGQKNTEADNILNFLPEIDVTTYKMDIDDEIKQVLES